MNKTNKNNKTNKIINIFEDCITVFKNIKEKEIKIRKNKITGYALPQINLAELTAPTNIKGQWKIISGMPGCGKTNLLIDYYKKLVKQFGKDPVAVMAIGERQIEIKKDWGSLVPSKHLFTIASDEEMPENLVNKLKNIVLKITDKPEYKAIIIDSLSGIYKIVANYNYISGSGLGAGGLNLKAPDFINVFIIKPLRCRFYGEKDKNTGCYEIKEYSDDRIIISSLLYGQESRDKKALYEAFKALCDSEIVLSEELARRRVFPAIDRRNSYSRRLEDFCSDGLLNFLHFYKELNIIEMKNII